MVLRRVWPVLLARRGVCPPRRRLCPRPPYLSVGGGFGRPGPQSELRRRWAALRGPPPPRFGFGGSVAAASRGVVRWLSRPVGGWGALPSSGRGRGVPQRADRDDLRWARPPGASPSPPLGDSAACGQRGKTGPHGGPEERVDPLRPRCARPPLPKQHVVFPAGKEHKMCDKILERFQYNRTRFLTTIERLCYNTNEAGQLHFIHWTPLWPSSSALSIVPHGQGCQCAHWHDLRSRWP